MDRREALKTLSFGTLAAGFMFTGCETIPKANENPFGKKVSPEDLERWNQSFFTDHEFETVRQLTNMIIPADDRSGNAEDAKVPEFIDFMMLDRPYYQTGVRGGLNWLDSQCRKLFGKDFIGCSEDEKKLILDKIAYPDQVEPGMEPGVEFFNTMRDFTASGFWSSKMGIEDLQYMGNVPYQWDGCPQEALDQLGVSYDEA